MMVKRREFIRLGFGIVGAAAVGDALAACAPAAIPALPSASPTPVAASSTLTASAPATPSVQRALVIGGGGPVGRAWDVGMLKGLRDAGIDVSQAELLVGTSSGANVAAQVASGKTVDGLYATFVAPAAAAPAPAASAPAFDAGYAQQTLDLVRSAISADPKGLPLAVRIQIGQRAVAATKVPSEDAQLQQATTQGLGGDIHSWPTRSLKIAATDVADGTIRFFDSTQGVPIERAAAASNAIPGQAPPITVGDHRYMDGFLGGANVDGAAGARIILMLTPSPLSPEAIQVEIERARAKGSQVLDISPDADARAAMGPNNQDRTKQRASAETGARQAAAVAAQVRAFWST